MQAVIMAAGKGVRMLPLTTNTPKPLLKIKDRTILDWTISQLPDEVDEIIMVIGYCGDQIRSHVEKFYPDRKVVFVEESESKGTGYAVKVCQPYVKGKFLVLNGDDLYGKQDLANLTKENAFAFLLKDVSNDPGFPDKFQRMTPISIDSNAYYTDHQNGKDSVLITIGAYLLNEKYFDFDLVELKNGEFGLPQTLFANAHQYPLKAVLAEFWVPIGFPEDLKYAEQFI